MKKNRLVQYATVMLPLLFFSLWSFAQTSVVKGTVTDEKGEPLVGVNVVIKGTTNGIITDVNGKYQLYAGPGSTLSFSFIGYKTQDIPVGNQKEINVKLLADNLQVEEVVVVGYGTQRKEAVTGSVASMGGEELRDVPSTDITQALQGRVAGVEMSQTSSKPGESMQIRIRGTRSLTASNDPLVVLDGIPFPGSINDISPSDIKSIDILKDASATAIYGSRGANGVILITTNKGQKGQKARIVYNGYYGAKTAIPYPMMNGPEFVALRERSGRYSNGEDESNDINTDWQSLFYRTAQVSNHDISVTGGTANGSYSFGMSYFEDQAVIPTQQYNRILMHASVDQEIGDYFRVGFNTNSNYNTNQGNQLGLYGVLSMSPISNPYNSDGTVKRTVKMILDEQFVMTKSVVEDLKNKWLNLTRGYATYNSVFGEVKIPWVKGLKYRTTLGLDFIQDNNGTYTAEGVNSTNPTNISSASISNSHRYHWTIENLLSYDRVFAEKHSLNVVALYSAEQNTTFNSGTSAKGIPSEDFQFYSLSKSTGEITTTNFTSNGGYTQTGLISYMGRVMYSYDGRYMLSATVRSDAASVLAKGHKWHTYPAISAGWNIKSESFMQNVTWLDYLKLRVGFGQTSNQAVGAYSTLGLLSSRDYNFGNSTYATGYYVTQLPNENLGWEYSKTWNYGLDFTVLNNRLTGTIEYYKTQTKDILLSLGLPPTSGVSSYTANIGETQNNGIELSLNGTIINNDNGWTWDLGLNLYANRNKLVALASQSQKDEGNGWFVGHNINAIFDYKKIGLWQQNDPYLDILEPGGNVGMIKVLYTGDYNADGTPVRQIGAADRQIMDIDPKFEGGFNTRVAYKGFDLTAVASFRSGGTLISTLYGGSSYLNMMTGRRGNIKVDYYTENNTGAKYPDPHGVISGDNPKYASTMSYFNGSYLKIRTLSLGYNFEQNEWVKNMGIAKLRLYFMVQNPLVLFSPFHKESGLDPETNSYGDQNVATGGYLNRILTVGFNTPSTHNYMVGLNLSF